MLEEVQWEEAVHLGRISPTGRGWDRTGGRGQHRWEGLVYVGGSEHVGGDSTGGGVSRGSSCDAV